MNLHLFELKLITLILQRIRSAPADLFFICYNTIDTLPFTILLIISLWFLYDGRKGKRLLYTFVLSSLFNGVLKWTFSLPRPCHLDSSIALLYLKSPGFPSGAAQSAALIIGVLFFETKNHWIRAGGALFATLLCFSRIYLGVHFITDILGGLVIGTLLAWIYRGLSKLSEKAEERIYHLFPLILVAISLKNYGPLIAFLVGISLSSRLPQKPLVTRLEKLTSLALALIGIFSLQALIHTFRWAAIPLSLLEGVIINHTSSWIAFHTSAWLETRRLS